MALRMDMSSGRGEPRASGTEGEDDADFWAGARIPRSFPKIVGAMIFTLL
jgi:hypothetical protein